MPYNIMFLENAGKDLEVIYGYLKQTAGREFALNEINALEAACNSLSDNPERGTVPQELERTGTFEYRQVIAKPYRIIYQVIENNVFIFGIIHGRRNIQSVLRQRIFIKPF